MNELIFMMSMVTGL